MENLNNTYNVLNVLVTVHRNIVIYRYCRTNRMHYLLTVVLQLIACTSFEHLFAHNQEVLYVQLLPTASQHTTHKIYKLLYIQCPLMISK
jgi:hypothetical protein